MKLLAAALAGAIVCLAVVWMSSRVLGGFDTDPAPTRSEIRSAPDPTADAAALDLQLDVAAANAATLAAGGTPARIAAVIEEGTPGASAAVGVAPAGVIAVRVGVRGPASLELCMGTRSLWRCRVRVPGSALRRSGGDTLAAARAALA